MGDAIIVTARDMEIMEEEGEAFIEDVFDEWTRGHFGKRLEREEVGGLDGATGVRETGVGEAEEIGEDALEALLGEVSSTPGSEATAEATAPPTATPTAPATT